MIVCHLYMQVSDTCLEYHATFSNEVDADQCGEELSLSDKHHDQDWHIFHVPADMTPPRFINR